MDSMCPDDTWYWCNYLWDLHSEGMAYTSVGTIVVYDWIIFLDQEIHFIWKRKWNLVKVLYIALRVIGAIYGITNVFNYAPLHVSDATCIAFAWIIPGSEALGFSVLQIVMIVRLYALSGQSKRLLALLVVGFVIAQGILYANTFRNAVDIGLSATDRQILGYPGFCLARWGNLLWPLLRGEYVSLLAFEVLMLGVSLYFFTKHVLQSRGLSGTWSTKNMVVLLVRDNVLYFLVTAAVFASESLSGLPQGWAPRNRVAFDVFNAVFSGVVVGVVGPHLVLSIISHHRPLSHGESSIMLIDMSRSPQGLVRA